MLNNNNYMYGDQCGEFVCGYWGLKDLIIKQIKYQVTSFHAKA